MTEFLRPDQTGDRVRAAVAAVAQGRPVVVVDDADREDEGDLVFAAVCATPALVAFTVRHTSGFVCVAMGEQDCDRLRLPPMHHRSEDRFGTAYRTTVDLRGTGTGISARSRAATIAALADPATTPHDLVRPGHVVPLMAREGGVLRRAGHTEAAVDLARLAGLPAVGALCEIVSVEHPGEMARGEELRRFAVQHGLVTVAIADLVAYRRRTEPQVRRVTSTSLPTTHGLVRAVGYLGVHDGGEHLALVTGGVDVAPTDADLVHVHVECLSGDVFGSQDCTCRGSLDVAIQRICAGGSGVVVYLRPPGRARSCALRGDCDATSPDVLQATADWILADLGLGALHAATGPGTGSVVQQVEQWQRRHAPPRSEVG